MTEPFKRKLPKHPTVWWSRTKLHWPFLVWLVAIAATVLLYSHGVEFPILSGILEVQEEVIAPVEDGILKELLVEESQAVKAGQVLAKMDSTLIDQEIKAEEALGVQEAGAVERYQQDAMRVRRQYVNDMDADETALLEQKRMLAEVKAEQEVLQKESVRLQSLVDQRLADATVLAKLGDMKARLAALMESSRMYPLSIESLEKEVASKKKQLEDMDRWMDVQQTQDGPGESQRMEMMKTQTQKYHQEQCNLLTLRRDRCTFLARGDGTVSRVLIRPGSTVTVGTPIMTIVREAGSRLVAFVPEGQAIHNVSAGMKAYVYRETESSVRYEAVVQGMGPEIYTRTVQAGIREQFIRGRRLALSLSGSHDLVPGESVSIAFEHRSLLSWITGRQATGQAPAPQEPVSQPQ